MKRPRARHFLAASAALTVLAVPVAGPAFAEGEAAPTTRVPRPSLDVDTVRDRCLAALDKRLATLDQLDARVSAADRLSDAQEAELHATIGATRDGLTGLRGEIEADTDAAELRADCARIVEDYRVYLLLGPQVRLVTAADSAQTVVARIDEVVPKIQAAIDEAAANGEDVTEATRLLGEVTSAGAEAGELAAGVLAAVSPLTPADYNAGTAKPVLDDARADMATVAKDLASARANIGLLVDLLA